MHLRTMRKRTLLVCVGVALAVLAVAAWAGKSASAAIFPQAITPHAGYACVNLSTHVAMTLLDTPSAKCPSGTTSIVIGAQGVQGIQGPKGDTGAAAPAPEFGIASVKVDRGSGPATWATYSAPLLGSPAGDQAQGAFRFTCNGSADCKLSLTAHATVAGWNVYPRILMMAQHDGTGPEAYCEYADGSDNSNATTSLSASDATVPLGIGGSLDCGSAQSFPAGGVVTEIDVPGGGSHYDVYTTLVFTKAA